MRFVQGTRTAAAIALASLLAVGGGARGAIVPTSENFEGAAIGTTVTIDTDFGDTQGTAGAKAVPSTGLSLMQSGGGTPGLGQTYVRFVNDASATHGNATSNATQYLEVGVPAETGSGSIAAVLYAAFPGDADGEAYIMKADIYNPHSALNVVPRLGVSQDISPSFANFGWHGASNAHSRMFDTAQNTDWQSWWLVTNDTNAPLQYLDPLGNVSVVAAQSSDRWIDGVLSAGGGSNNMGTATADLMGIASGATTTGGAEFIYYVDNMSIQAVPEPSAIVLLGIGAAALVLRRRWA